jgi:hypothetical protein
MNDPNKLHHIFGKPAHGLGPLVRQYGSQQAAGQAIYDVVNSAHQNGSLRSDGVGYYKQLFDIGGNMVTVSGRVVDGIVYVGTAWIAP